MKWLRRRKFIRRIRAALADAKTRDRWKVALTKAAKNDDGLEDLWSFVDEADRLW